MSEREAFNSKTGEKLSQKETDEKLSPDWSRECGVCGGTPVVPVTDLCGPCTFGEAETAGGELVMEELKDQIAHLHGSITTIQIMLVFVMFGVALIFFGNIEAHKKDRNRALDWNIKKIQEHEKNAQKEVLEGLLEFEKKECYGQAYCGSKEMELMLEEINRQLKDLEKK